MSVEVGLVILVIVIGLQLVPVPPGGDYQAPPGLRWGSSARLWHGGSRP